MEYLVLVEEPTTFMIRSLDRLWIRGREFLRKRPLIVLGCRWWNHVYCSAGFVFVVCWLWLWCHIVVGGVALWLEHWSRLENYFYHAVYCQLD